jgi:hypothetical protein
VYLLQKNLEANLDQPPDLYHIRQWHRDYLLQRFPMLHGAMNRAAAHRSDALCDARLRNDLTSTPRPDQWLPHCAFSLLQALFKCFVPVSTTTVF